MWHTFRFVATLALAIGTNAAAAPCDPEDPRSQVSGIEQCLVLRQYGSQQPEVMVVWLHGNISDSTAPANYHFALASELVSLMPETALLSVALVRPGYPDGEGRSSSVAFLHSGRGDNFTRTNIAEVAAAVERLRAHYKPKRVLLVGHSGGAATAAVIMGLRPKLAEAAILLACPCNLVSWRAGRQPYGRSEDPTSWIQAVDPKAQIAVLTGDGDGNTLPGQAHGYVAALRERMVAADFVLVPGAGHNSVIRAPETWRTIQALAKGQ